MTSAGKRAVPADIEQVAIEASIVRKRAAQRQEDDEQYGLDEMRNAAQHSTLDVTNRYAAQRAAEDAE